MKHIGQHTYQEDFSTGDNSLPIPRRAEAVKQALDIRKFEIDLYWRRATYFWTFIGAAFVAYGVAQNLREPMRSDLSVFAGCLGLVFSVAWYCVNRGSKQWQANWEYHVDNLENPVMGPLYKTVISAPKPIGLRNKLQSCLIGPGNFSVSKVNQIVSVFVTVFWMILVTHALPRFSLEARVNWYYVFLLVAVGLAIACMFTLGRGSLADSEGIAMQRDAILHEPAKGMERRP